MVKCLLRVVLLMLGCVSFAFAMEDIPTHNMHMQGDIDSTPIYEKNSKPTVQLQIYKILDNKGTKNVQIKLKNTSNGHLVTLADLIEAHTQKIHLLIIDDSLEDYSHVHPKALKTPGLYEFEWQQKKKNVSYYIWADIVPLSTGKEEYDEANLIISHVKKPVINTNTVMQASVQGYNFKLSFDNQLLKVGKPVMGKIFITDTNGNPVNNLESVLGSFGHIVGFSEDLKTVIHIHPMGKEPLSPDDRGGPELQFHLIPETSGFIKLFAQVKINGKEIFVPFGVNVSINN